MSKLLHVFDMAIYYLFYWRWNKKLRDNNELRKFFINYMTDYDNQMKGG